MDYEDQDTLPSESIATIAEMIREAEKHADDMSPDRIRALEYYDGKMVDTPADKGRSQMVTQDLRAQVKKVLPSVIRTILGSEKIGEFLPVDEGDEQGAEQATDYISSVIAPEVDLRRHIEDAIHDALIVRNGILRWWWEEKRSVCISEHSGLSQEGYDALTSEEGTEVVDVEERQEVIEAESPDQPGQMVQMPISVFDVTIKRVEAKSGARVACVPRDRFLIHPDATTLDDSLLTGEISKLTRSDLVAMGYDRDTVMGLTIAGEDDEEEDARRRGTLDSDERHRPNEPIDYYDIYVRFDADEDGIAELRHMCFAGGLHEQNLLMDEPADEVQYCDLRVMSRPHQWEGISLADDVMSIQRAKTVLLRSTFDNLYWQNNPQPIMQDGAVKNPNAVFSPEFGLPIRVREGVDIRGVMGFNQVPFVAKESFSMLEYMDMEAQERTGVTDASAGLPADALQNMTATASAMLNQQGIGQTELMVSTVAVGLRKLFRGLLRLIIKHQDIPKTVRLRGDWVEFDPRHWNANMDCTVNVGLGAGTRERDMQVMQLVMGIQEKLLSTMGPDNPFVKPGNLWQSLSKLVEAAGLRSPDMYFTEPDPEEVAQKLAQAGTDPKQAEMQAKMQMEQAQMQMDMQMRQAEMQQEMTLKREQMQIESELKREQMAAEMQLKREQMAMQASMPEGGSIGRSIRMGGEIG